LYTCLCTWVVQSCTCAPGRCALRTCASGSCAPSTSSRSSTSSRTGTKGSGTGSSTQERRKEAQEKARQNAVAALAKACADLSKQLQSQLWYLKPESTVFPEVDSFRPPQLMFQLSCSWQSEVHLHVQPASAGPGAGCCACSMHNTCHLTYGCRLARRRRPIGRSSSVLWQQLGSFCSALLRAVLFASCLACI
jgi:hypothetical protein